MDQRTKLSVAEAERVAVVQAVAEGRLKHAEAAELLFCALIRAEVAFLDWVAP